MKEKFAQLKCFNWHLWVSLCLLALVPAVYQVVKTFLISATDQGGVFNIIGQMEWFDLINETLQAFLIVPLYSVLNKIFKQRPDRFSYAVFKTGLVTFVLYTAFSIGVFIYGETLIRAMNPDNTNISAVSRYLGLETAAFVIGIIISFISTVFVVCEKYKNIYILLAVRTALSLCADFLLIPRFSIDGAAVSNIIVYALLAAASIRLLYTQKLLSACQFKKSDLAVFRDWCKKGAFSGAQQFLDNFIYAVMICKMVNLVAEQGNYWLANNFIWGWMLIPISALAEVIRSDCKNGYAKLRQFNYYFISCVCIALWAFSVPAWEPFSGLPKACPTPMRYSP